MDIRKISDAKAGDTIFAHEWGRGRLHTVTRITPTLIVCGSARFVKSNGRAYGSEGMYAQRARIATPTDILTVRIQKAEACLRDLKLNSETVDAAETLIKATKT